MGYLIAGMVIALGITMVIGGATGSGSQLFQAITGMLPSGGSQSGQTYGNLSGGTASTALYAQQAAGGVTTQGPAAQSPATGGGSTGSSIYSGVLSA